MSSTSSWTTQRTPSPDDLKTEILVVTRHAPHPQIRLEIQAPQLAGAAGNVEIRLSRAAIKDAVKALQAAMDSDVLPGHIECHARQI